MKELKAFDKEDANAGIEKLCKEYGLGYKTPDTLMLINIC